MWWGVLCFAICYSHYSRTSNSNTWVYFSELQAAVQSIIVIIVVLYCIIMQLLHYTVNRVVSDLDHACVIYI